MPRHLPSLILFVIAGGLWLVGGAYTAIFPPATVARAVEASGQEEPEEGALFLNGFNVRDVGPIRFRTFYEQYGEAFLGEPVGPFDGTSQAFRFGRLTFTASNPPDWQIQFANSGEQDLRLEGYLPRPGSSPHSALRDYLLALLERGIDVPRVIGPIISEPICDSKKKTCSQWSAKARFEFSPDALSGEDVRRLPIGLWLTHPKVRTEMTIPPTDPPSVAERLLNAPNVIGLVLALLAVLLLLRPRQQGIGSAPL